MELSPLAREKLARIGELTEEEKARLKYAGQLNSLLAEYYTNKLSPEDLWKELKKYKEEGQISMLPEAQLKLLETLNLSLSDADFENRRKAILAIQTLKDNADYLRLEQALKSIESIRQQYREEMRKTYDALKVQVEQQVKQAARRLAGQTAARGTVDIEGSVEASIKATPEWKSFITRHENTCNQKFKDQLEKIRKKLQG
jgi:hypothetical protein